MLASTGPRAGASLRRAARTLLCGLAVASAPLLALSATGCKRGPAMQKVEAPAAGVTLKYDFTPGTRYRGHVERSETLQFVAMPVNITRSIKFDVTLTVRGKDPSNGGNLLTAKISNVDIVWGMPPQSPVGVSEIKAFAIQNLNNSEVNFNVDDNGKVVYMPKIPADVSPELTAAIQQALDALEFSFYEVPNRPLKIGESWDEDKQRGRKGKLGRFTEGTLTTTVEGLYKLDSGLEVAQLESKETEIETTTAKSGSHEVKREGKAESLFATAEGYLRERTSDYTTFDTGNSTTFTKVRVSWSKTGAAQVQAPTAVETQTISDPCNPDYVGPEECQADGATETQNISDPCNPDYVGPEECKADASPDAEAAPGGNEP